MQLVTIAGGMWIIIGCAAIGLGMWILFTSIPSEHCDKGKKGLFVIGRDKKGYEIIYKDGKKMYVFHGQSLPPFK